jgi:membrane dipeptidase
MLIVDGHEDLAYNMLTFQRDYTRSVVETRRIEAGGTTPIHNEDSVLGWSEYQRGQVAVINAVLFVAPERRSAGSFESQYYSDYSQAHHLYSAQLDAYHRLVNDHSDKFRLILNHQDLDEVWEAWQQPGQANSPDAEDQGHPVGRPVGLVVLMEGAEGVREPDELESWWQRGVRLIGPAWAGTRYCGGTREPGPLTKDGYALLEGMAEFNFILDLTHMDEAAVLQSLETYPRQIVASHSNALALLKGVEGNRHLSDRVIQGIFERDGLIGVVICNGFLKAGWKRGDRREEVTLQHVVAQIDYLCQMAGDSRHVGIGSDMDGGFGLQSMPVGIDTIADLQKLAPLLAEKGYSPEDIAGIFGENWLKRFRQSLPEKR